MRHLWLLLLLLAGPVGGLAQDATPAFEVASIRPNISSDLSIPGGSITPDGVRMINYSLGNIIRFAYGIQAFRVIGAPGWIEQERFDIEARAAAPITDEQRRVMLRSLLTERFQLRARLEPRDQQVYVVAPARPDRRLGPGLTPRPECATAECAVAGSMNPRAGLAQMRAMSVTDLTRGVFSNILNQVVYDETGIAGRFDVELSWRPDAAAVDPADARASFFTAVEEQLGLILSPQRRPVEMLIIESISRPTPN